MKMVIAVIKPHRLDQVRDALTNIDVHGLTVSEVRGYGRQGGHTEIYRGAEYQVNFVPKLKLEVAVPENLSERVVECVRDAANNDQIGDGKIFVVDLEQVIRIRTGETGHEAI